MRGNLESKCAYSGKNSEMACEDLQFTTQADCWQKNILQQPKNSNKNCNAQGKGGSEFQSYHIIKFQCPVFHKKSPGIQRNRKVWPIQYKNIIK